MNLSVLGEALRRGTLIYMRFSLFKFELLFMSISLKKNVYTGIQKKRSVPDC